MTACLLCVLTASGRGRRLMPATSSPASAAATAAMDPAFKVIPRNSTCFLIWRVEVPYVIVTMTTVAETSQLLLSQFSFVSELQSRSLKY